MKHFWLIILVDVVDVRNFHFAFFTTIGLSTSQIQELIWEFSELPIKLILIIQFQTQEMTIK